MNKIILLAVIVSSFSAFAQDPGDTPALSYNLPKNDSDFNPRMNHWVSTFGFEGMKYQVPFTFTGGVRTAGDRASFKPKDQEIWGGRMGFGREFYLGKSFNTTTKVEGYYSGTLFSTLQNAGPADTDINFAYTKRTSQIFGVDLSQSLGMLFDMKTKNPFFGDYHYMTVEPYVEGGIGWGQAYNRINYHYDTGSVNEDYRQSITDQLLNVKFGLGVNITSSKGYFLYLKGTMNNYKVTSRKSRGFSNPQGGSYQSLNSTDKNVNIDPIFIYALGGGYKF